MMFPSSLPDFPGFQRFYICFVLAIYTYKDHGRYSVFGDVPSQPRADAADEHSTSEDVPEMLGNPLGKAVGNRGKLVNASTMIHN
jgi:hypothetical protein